MCALSPAVVRLPMPTASLPCWSEVAKQKLSMECDYNNEATAQERFHGLIMRWPNRSYSLSATTMTRLQLRNATMA